MGKKLKFIPEGSEIELNRDEEKFAQKFLQCKNKTEAYRCVFPQTCGTMKKSDQWSIASHFSNRPAVASRINELIDLSIKDIKLNKERYLRELDNIAKVNVCDIMTVESVTGRDGVERSKFFIQDFSQLTDEQQRAVCSIKNSEHGIEVTFHDKIKAIGQLSKMLNFEKHEVEVSGTIGIEWKEEFYKEDENE